MNTANIEKLIDALKSVPEEEFGFDMSIIYKNKSKRCCGCLCGMLIYTGEVGFERTANHTARYD